MKNLGSYKLWGRVMHIMAIYLLVDAFFEFMMIKMGIGSIQAYGLRMQGPSIQYAMKTVIMMAVSGIALGVITLLFDIKIYQCPSCKKRLQTKTWIRGFTNTLNSSQCSACGSDVNSIQRQLVAIEMPLFMASILTMIICTLIWIWALMQQFNLI